MQEVAIKIPLSDFDIEQLKDEIVNGNQEITWTFTSDTQGVDVKVTFIKEDADD